METSRFFLAAGRIPASIPHAQQIVALSYGKVVIACQPETMRNRYYRAGVDGAGLVCKRSFTISRRDTPELRKDIRARNRGRGATLE
jgi:hypothetical protein